MKPEKRRFLLYAITPGDGSEPDHIVQKAAALLRAGVDWLQVREKGLSDRRIHEILVALKPEAERSGALLLVNGRPDIAAAAGISGVQLPAGGLPLARLRGKFPPPFWIALSCHSAAEAIAAEQDGADAVTLGPIFHTPSKAPFGPPLGLAPLQEACLSLKVPVLGLGGVSAANVMEIAASGGAGAAAIRLFWEAQDPSALVQTLRRRYPEPAGAPARSLRS